MAIFCTQCGASAAPDTLFCENCGAGLRRPTAATMPAPDPAPAGTRSHKFLYAGIAFAALLLAGAGGAYVVFKTPEPTAARLLAGFSSSDATALAAASRQELCLSNLDYGVERLNVSQFDRQSQSWLDTLSAAGLFSAGVQVEGLGLFAQPLVQYSAKPELANWREGSRLCLVKGVELASVIDIAQVPRPSGDGASPPIVAAKLLLRSAETAPWLANKAVRDVVTKRMTGWDYQDGKLQKTLDVRFAFRDGAWAPVSTGNARLDAQRARLASATKALGTAAPSGSGFSFLTNLFSFGGHPLKGTWQLETEPSSRPFGRMALDGVLDARITFTADAIGTAAGKIRSRFEVDGQRVIVTPEGASSGLVFVMQDSDTASVDLGLFQAVYKRIH